MSSPEQRSRLVSRTYDELRIFSQPFIQAETEIRRALYGSVPERIGFIALEVSLDVLQREAEERGYILKDDTESMRKFMTGEHQVKFYRCERADQMWEPNIGFWELPGIGMCIEDTYFGLYNLRFFPNQERR